MCITSNVGDYRNWDQVVPMPIPYNYQKKWEQLKQLIPTKPIADLDFSDIENLIEAYLQALQYDINNNEPNCHAKHKHEELEDLSLLLLKRINRFINKGHYEKAKKALDLKVRLDSLVAKLNEYAVCP